MKRLQHSLVIGDDRWHAKWYRHWVSLGGKEPAYKENLCHYVRVLLLWAPLRWFFKGKIKGVIPPWAATLISVVVAVIAATALIWPTLALEFWLFALMVAAVIAVIAGVGFLAVYLDDNPSAARKAAAITMPLWILPYAFVVAGVRLWETMDDGIESIAEWFLYRNFLIEGFTPLVMSGIIGLTVFAVLLTHAFLIILAIIAFSAGLLLLFGGLLFMLYLIGEFLEGSGAPERVKRFASGTTDTVKLGATYVNTKKVGSRICPFIEVKPVEFEQEPSEATSP